jgi:hypothetical protein
VAVGVGRLDDENRVKWASEYGQITKIGLSDGCAGENIPMMVGFG